eukprot:scaffold7832_cov267-Pinguiococcus_pyrenoidosus.AAC.2
MMCVLSCPLSWLLSRPPPYLLRPMLLEAQNSFEHILAISQVSDQVVRQSSQETQRRRHEAWQIPTSQSRDHVVQKRLQLRNCGEGVDTRRQAVRGSLDLLGLVFEHQGAPQEHSLRKNPQIR